MEDTAESSPFARRVCRFAGIKPVAIHELTPLTLTLDGLKYATPCARSQFTSTTALARDMGG